MKEYVLSTGAAKTEARQRTAICTQIMYRLGRKCAQKGRKNTSKTTNFEYFYVVMEGSSRTFCVSVFVILSFLIKSKQFQFVFRAARGYHDVHSRRVRRGRGSVT